MKPAILTEEQEIHQEIVVLQDEHRNLTNSLGNLQRGTIFHQQTMQRIRIAGSKLRQMKRLEDSIWDKKLATIH